MIRKLGNLHADTVKRTRRGGARAELQCARHSGGGLGGGDTREATEVDGALLEKTGGAGGGGAEELVCIITG